MVPVEGIEPPTFGLQNRCSTAELNRHVVGCVADNIRLVEFQFSGIVMPSHDGIRTPS